LCFLLFHYADSFIHSFIRSFIHSLTHISNTNKKERKLQAEKRKNSDYGKCKHRQMIS